MKLNIESLRKTMADKHHIPVMAEQVQEYCPLPKDGCLVDCTIGLGGHARLMTQRLGSDGHLIGIDRDKHSLAIARTALEPCSAKIDLVHDDYRQLDRILDALHVDQVDAILFDLGISSFQLNNAARGFSFRADGPLDMRINQDSFVSAYDLINNLSEKEISLILKNYGQERWHHRIARYLVELRSKAPIETTGELRQAVLRAMPPGQRRQKIDPATRTFQAFRIAVNRELESLEMALKKVPRYLKRQGRLCVISFHSLEDRIVKQTLRVFAAQHILKIVVKKPLRPSEKEIQSNQRARSARLRIAEKI